jgi:uncharacterized protein YigE (DUF2233 family)
MKKVALKLLLLIAISGLLTACHQNAAQTSGVASSADSSLQDNSTWKEVRPGLSYATLSLNIENGKGPKSLIIARVDPKKYEFGIYQNKDKQTAGTIKEIHEQSGSLLTFNGGFFTEDFKPTGLLISKNKTLRKASPASLLNGVFAISKYGKADMLESGDSLNSPDYTFAIQGGPLLIDKNGEIAVNDKSPDTASRTAVGLDKNGNVVLVLIKQSLLNMDNEITLYQFARLLKDAPELKDLGLHGVLNLDGGTSSGLMIDSQYYPEMVKVQNVVIVKEKTNA